MGATETPPEEDEVVIEAVATEVKEDEPAVATQVVTKAVTPAPSRQALMPLAADDVVAGMTAYQELLPRLLDASDYQQAGPKRFVKKSGWRKIARAFNLSVTVQSLRVERDEEGNVARAECVARATAPNGQVQDGDGYCSADETRFTEEKGRQKLENDLRATATTRAKNRAIADLVGMGEVSAEEVGLAGQGGPSFERASAEEQTRAKQALGQIVGADRARTIYIEALSHFDNLCPKGLAVALARLTEPTQPSVPSDLPADTDV